MTRPNNSGFALQANSSLLLQSASSRTYSAKKLQILCITRMTCDVGSSGGTLVQTSTGKNHSSLVQVGPYSRKAQKLKAQ